MSSVGDDVDLAGALDAWAGSALVDADAPPMREALARWRVEVGDLRGDDAEFDLWAAMRADWMLVECGLGDATCTDAVRRRLAHSFVGLFEVWPTDRGRAWLRDRLGGLCLSLQDGERIGASSLQRTADGPAALWELRGIVGESGLVPCRWPIAHPLAVVELFGEPARPGLGRPQRWLAAARHARLVHGRMPRADPRPVYRAALLAAVR